MYYNELIAEKVNPAIVSKIYWCKGYRVYKPHPLYYKLHKKKYGKWAWKYQEHFAKSYFKPATVIILGSDGSKILVLEYKSNEKAKQAADQFRFKLNMWVTKMKQKEDFMRIGTVYYG